jgi:hypothetical protein
MGGEFIGNGSVYWSVGHADGADLKVKTNDPNRPPKNGSTNVHTKTQAQGRDQISIDDVGKKYDHARHFRVTMRFPSERAMQDALNEASRSGNDATGWTLVIDVPVIERDDPGQNPPGEVRVDW